MDTMTVKHFWKSLVSVADELLSHNDMGDHCSSRLVVPKSAYLPNSAMRNGTRWALMVCIVGCVLKISKGSATDMLVGADVGGTDLGGCGSSSLCTTKVKTMRQELKGNDKST